VLAFLLFSFSLCSVMCDALPLLFKFLIRTFSLEITGGVRVPCPGNWPTLRVSQNSITILRWKWTPPYFRKAVFVLCLDLHVRPSGHPIKHVNCFNRVYNKVGTVLFTRVARQAKRLPSSGLWHRVAWAGTDVSEELLHSSSGLK
jgi:hypothetical protein